MKRWWFYLWLRVAITAVHGMGKNASTHKRTSVANRVTHRIVQGEQEFVFTFADLTKPNALSREEIVELERIVANERQRQEFRR